MVMLNCGVNGMTLLDYREEWIDSFKILLDLMLVE